MVFIYVLVLLAIHSISHTPFKPRFRGMATDYMDTEVPSLSITTLSLKLLYNAGQDLHLTW